MKDSQHPLKDPWPVGRTFRDRPYIATPQRLHDAVLAIGAEDNSWYSSAFSPYGRPICPASILSFEPSLFPDWELFGTRQAFNSRNEWMFFRPIWPGETLMLHMSIVDRWLKRSKEHVTFGMTACDADGRLVAECRFTEAVINPPIYEPPLPARDNDPPSLRVRSTGPELGHLSRTYTIEMSRALRGSVIDWHTDRALAQQRGFPQPVLLGAQFVGQACELMTRTFGSGFLEGGRLALNALKPVLVGETITACLAEHERTTDSDGIKRIHAAIWCKRESGETIAAGVASARLI